MIPKHLAVWLESVVTAVPRNVRLIYIKWNEGGRGSQPVLWFNAFGYTIGDFDPEDSSSLSALSEWVWEAAEPCATSSELALDDQVLAQSIEELFAADHSILDPFIRRGGRIAFGRHDSSVGVFPPLDRPPASTCYYELHVASQSNHVEASRFDEFDSKALDQVIEYRKFECPFPAEATFHLQPQGKERDLLWAVRYFLCSDRMRELIQSATDQCQVFPINLYRSNKAGQTKRISGYYVVNLYEQLSCLDPTTVLPPPYEGFLPTFDPERGYRIVRAKVGKRNIFRIAYEHRRLLVSHAFRTKCERVGITGVEWLRRESV